ncbi:MAG: hypothetical protein QXN24_05955 [Candidatus Bathyarchaeia archaeon]
MPICIPIREPVRIKSTNVKLTFPLRACVKDAYREFNSIQKAHVPDAAAGSKLAT